MAQAARLAQHQIGGNGLWIALQGQASHQAFVVFTRIGQRRFAHHQRAPQAHHLRVQTINFGLLPCHHTGAAFLNLAIGPAYGKMLV